MRVIVAKYLNLTCLLMMMALPALMAVSKAWHILPMAELRKIYFVLWLLAFLYSAAVLMAMLWVRRKLKLDPEWKMDLPKPVKWVVLGLIACFWFVYVFFSMWPVHQGLASVESRWQFAFLVGMLVVAGYFLVRPRKVSAQEATSGARPGLWKILLPRLLPLIGIVLILNIVFYFWPITR